MVHQRTEQSTGFITSKKNAILHSCLLFIQFGGLVPIVPVVKTIETIQEESYRVLVIIYYVVAFDTQISETKGQLDESLKAHYLWLSKASLQETTKGSSCILQCCFSTICKQVAGD